MKASKKSLWLATVALASMAGFSAIGCTATAEEGESTDAAQALTAWNESPRAATVNVLTSNPNNPVVVGVEYGSNYAVLGRNASPKPRRIYVTEAARWLVRPVDRVRFDDASSATFEVAGVTHDARIVGSAENVFEVVLTTGAFQETMLVRANDTSVWDADANRAVLQIAMSVVAATPDELARPAPARAASLRMKTISASSSLTTLFAYASCLCGAQGGEYEEWDGTFSNGVTCKPKGYTAKVDTGGSTYPLRGQFFLFGTWFEPEPGFPGMVSAGLNILAATTPDGSKPMAEPACSKEKAAVDALDNQWAKQCANTIATCGSAQGFRCMDGVTTTENGCAPK